MRARAKDLQFLERQQELRVMTWASLAPYLEKKQSIEEFWPLPTDASWVPVSKRKSQLETLMDLREQTIAYYKTLQNG